MTEIEDAQNIYVQELKGGQMSEINKVIDSLQMDKEPMLEQPIKKGTPCLAQFSQDDEWYRARYVQKDKKDFQVFFIDFGNVDYCQMTHLRKMPTSLIAIPA